MTTQGSLLAISGGNAIYIITKNSPDSWGTLTALPPPPSPFHSHTVSLTGPVATCIHFINNDRLVATFLQHGIVGYDLHTHSILWQLQPRTCYTGASHLSPDNSAVATTNLYDGIDWYTLQGVHLEGLRLKRHSYTTLMNIREDLNVILPIKFIEGGTAILLGGTDGLAHIISSGIGGGDRQVLDHHDGVVQALVSRPLFGIGTFAF
ncbi:hypothetical protein K488DRAFT_90381 [Vararia minispora EC-137]|uniref:Uncharacterized protein n=1 Tax=Vararia minispora EC-137 TaxID=1314806 RepID=A0ACB8Q9F4_9AGAM|nr:hypothetical protein K488DRAFT_90381 [Vararia minispora EC-137]